MNSGHDTSEEAKNKNVGKHARVFDVDAMFSAAVHSAQMSSAEATMARLGRQEEESGDQEEKEGTNSADRQKARIEQRKATEGIRKIRIPDAERNSADDGDEIGPPMPNKMTASEEDEDDDEFVGPPMPPDFSGDKSTQVSEEEKQRILDSGIVDEEDEEEFDDFAGVPIVQMIPAGCEATIRHGKKPVSALAFDYQGLRFLTGGYDYMVDLFEFQKMDMTLKPTRELMPVESHVITSLSFNANGEHILVGSGNAQLRLLDRRGHQWAETVRGDQYLVDLTNTKGHTAAVNCCCWNPLLKDEFCSAGDDGTLRLWNLEDYKQITHCINKQRTVIKTKNANGKRAIPTSCCYSRDAKLIAAGCDDGSLQIWKYGKIFVAPKYLNRAAHKGPITCLAFSPDGKRILTRGLDDALKMFELAYIKEPVLTADKLENNFPMTDCGFSPRGEMVYTGTSVRSDAEDAAGRLLFLDASNFDPVYQIQYPGLSCIRIAWHPKLNQMLTGLSDGTCRLYYDLAQSHRGALECVTRPLRRQRKAEVIKEEMILAPLTLEMFQARGEDNEEKEVTSWRLKKYLRNQDNKLRPAFRKPAELPMSGPSTGGRIAAHGGTLHSYVAQQVGVKRNMELVNDDVRASILRHAEEAEANPMYVAQAYLKNQPKPIFQEKTTEPEDEDEYDAEDSHPFKMPRMAQ